MKVWGLLLLAAITRESILTNFSITQARQANISWVAIHSIFVLFTFLDIIVIYYFTKLFLKKVESRRIGKILDNYSKKVSTILNKFGEIKGLFIIGFFGSIAIDAIAAAWLNLDFKKSLLIFAFTDLLWYASVVMVGIGVKNAIPDERIALILFAIIAFAFYWISKKLFHIFSRI